MSQSEPSPRLAGSKRRQAGDAERGSHLRAASRSRSLPAQRKFSDQSENVSTKVSDQAEKCAEGRKAVGTLFLEELLFCARSAGDSLAFSLVCLV